MISMATWRAGTAVERERRGGGSREGRLPRYAQPSQVPKLASSRNPARWLFSGWNCTAKILARGHRASKRRRIAPSPRSARGLRGPGNSCARNRSACRRRCRAQSGCGARLLHLVPAHVRHLEPLAVRVRHRRRRGSAAPCPGAAPRPACRPSSLRSNSICRPMQMPRNGRSRAPRRPRRAGRCASSSRMQSGIAPCPGSTTRSASPDDVRVAR